MLIRLVELAEPDERERLRTLLGAPRERRTLDEVRWVRERMEAYGCIDYGREACNALAGAAQQEFSRIYSAVPDSRDKEFIGELPAWVIERT